MNGTTKLSDAEIQKWKEKLAAVKIKDGEITQVEYREEKTDNSYVGIPFPRTPELFRVMAVLRPSKTSEILVEVWLPLTEWNGRFLGTGNGGAAGEIVLFSLLCGAAKGYAVANTNLGTPKDAKAMCKDMDRVYDFGFQATHLMTIVGKQLVEQFYGRSAQYSYFEGSSTGGQQAFREAQDFPEDYDGIVVNAPAYNRVRLHTSFVWNYQQMFREGVPAINMEQASAVTKRLVEEYGEDALSGPQDSFLAYPERIAIDYGIFRDAKMERPLTKGQVDVLRKIYEGPKDPVTGELIYTGYLNGYDLLYAGMEDENTRISCENTFFFPFWWLWGEKFDPMSFDFHQDYQEALEKLGPMMDAISTDLSAFRDRGGKILMYHGTCDPYIPYKDSENYYLKVVREEGSLKKAQQYFLYYLIPGFGHTLGGPGIQALGGLSFLEDPMHDPVAAVAAWVEKGERPEKLLAVSFENNLPAGKIAKEYPIYPYTQR